MPLRLVMSIAFFVSSTIDAADHLFDRAEAELCHNLAQFLRDELHEVDDMLRIAHELLAKLRILRRDADRTSIQLADAHHDAAEYDERSRREAEFLRTEQGGDRDVAAGHHLAVRLDDDAVAQVVQHKRLMRLRQSELPRHARMTDRTDRRSACSAVIAADEDDVRVPFGNAGRDRANADFGYELDVDARARVGVLQIVNQLRQILDRINIMMRRRRNQAYAWRGAANFGNPRVDLRPGQLSAFARLRALRHLDLNLVGIDQVVARDAEAAGSDLLDRAAAGIAVRIRREALRIFAAFAGIALAADAVHRDRQRFMRFFADRTVGHRAGFEPFEDRFDRFDFFDRNRLLVELEIQAANASVQHLLVFALHERGILLVQSRNCSYG